MALNNMHVKEIDRNLYCKWMSGHGTFARMGVQGDGSCFFHSCCALLNKNNYLLSSNDEQKAIAYEFRCDFTKKFTLQDYDELKTSETKDFESTKDGFCVPKTWADEMMIKFASRVLNLNLIFLDLKNNKAYCGVHGQETIDNMLKDKMIHQNMGLVAWVDRSHFEPFVRVDDANTGLITTIFEPSKHQKDLEFTRALVGEYMSGCKIKK